jgi:DNA-binding transcriptional ArsR family regulator
MNESLSNTAQLLGDPGRAAILLRLMGGIALPAGELAATANIAPQTASEHLAKLVKGRLLSVERQGRHRYYRLAGAEIADAVEALLVLTARPQSDHAHASKNAAATTPQHGTIQHARTCYGHLAGWLGVRITDALLQQNFLQEATAKSYAVTPEGRAFFEKSLNIKLPPLNSPHANKKSAQQKLARRCLDWTERRHHLAGTLGCALYQRLRELHYLAPIANTRIIRVTLEGRTQLYHLLRISTGQ